MQNFWLGYYMVGFWRQGGYLNENMTHPVLLNHFCLGDHLLDTPVSFLSMVVTFSTGLITTNY
jgi:hypothetical protein